MSNEWLKLGISNKCNVTCNCSYKDGPFVAKREDALPSDIGFTRYTHSLSSGGPFTLKRELAKGGGQIGVTPGSDTEIQTVTEVSVYYWNGEPDNPILLGIKKSSLQDDSNQPKYYGKLLSVWGPSQVEGLEEQQALDHQNCQHNSAIPFDIKNPLLFSASNSECLNSRTQVISSNGSRQIGKDDRYLIEYYKINNVNVKISRATYNNEDTTVTPPNIPISQIRVYYWSKRPSEPLMVEFKPRGRWESVWFERLTHAGTVWESICKIDSEAFYSEPKKLDSIPQFIKRLDKVSCTINHAVKIDISKKDVRYCHEKCSNKRIYSKRVSSEIPNYIIYEHISAIDNEKTFTISSIYNDIIKQDIGDLVLNLYNIEKLIVFFPTCNERVPVAIHIEHMVGPIKEDKWLERTSDDNWRDVTIDFQGKTGDVVALKGLMDKIREDTEACNQYHLPNTQHTSALAGKVPTLDDETVDVSLKNDLGGDDLGYGDEEYYEVKEEDKLEIPTLSALQSSPQGITIDIRRKLSEDGGTYIPPNGQIVQLSREEYPLGSGFYKFTHKSPSGGSFKVKEVKYDGKTINHSRLQFDNASDIEHLAVWYWSGDTSMNSPLLTEVKVRAGEYKYSKNEGGNNWVQHARDSSEEKRPFQGESLEHTLDGLNCQHNNAVTMDLSFQNSEERSKKHTSSGNGNRYCCIYHKETSAKRITVTPHEVSCTEHSNNSTHIPYFKHDVTCAGKVKLAKIKYYPNGSNNSIRKRIKLEDNDFPIEGSLTVSAFYCTGEAPVLIYLEYNGKKDHLKGWYKKGTQDTDPWGRVAGNISTKTPYGIKSCSDERFKALVKELSSFGCKYGQCPEYTKLSFPQDFGRSSATGREPPVVNDGKTGGDIGEDCLKTLVNLGITGSVVASAVGIETLRTTLELARKAIDALPTENHTTKGYFAPVMGSQGSGAAGSSGPKIPEGQNFVQNAQDSSSENLKSEPALKAVNGSSVAPTQQPSAYGDSNSGKNAKAEGLPKIDELPQAEEAVSRYSESSEKEQNVVKSEISQLTKTSLQATETQGEGIRPGPAPAGGGGGETSKADPPAEGQPKVAGSTSSASQPPGEPKSPQAIVAETAATATGLGVIFGSSSGTLAGAGGLTGFGWWIYKRSRGDPWVRHGYPRVFKECAILSMHRSTCGLLL
ncbi:hypothetical protein BEWA_014080 [Theileria equi strain WA]|uniref:Uncharacterized protein n=1 Tax=Theileria equi strain WA TaxID=1537102 RepID=L1LC48_THEEQ|nr:hypothetical protein BEWA_014080 [Theileria equi strain WA]EKX72849.1 hypothetical protein BEWA_014080 [Theileria equi strain WA]|eukprot:XP_004832301.1 hypothetical protein BEWA_014080 [Theileria equi strain WA]